MLKKISLSEQHRLIISSIVALVVLIIFYYPSTQVPLSYFHNDDSGLMARLNGLNNLSDISNFIFSLENYKIRPLAYFQYVLEHFLFDNNYNLYIFYNICLVLVLNIIFLQFIKEQNVAVCIMLSLVLVTSKLFTYPVWNITGSFETLAAIIFLLIVFFVWSGSKTSKKKLILLAFMLIFTSERYLPFLVALPVIYHYKNTGDNFVVSIWRGSKYSVIILLAYLAFRFSLGVPLIVGTQTDNVVESFSGVRFITNALKAYVEIFGFSIGPRYLTGFEFASWVPVNAWDSVYLRGSILSLLLLAVTFYYYVFRCFEVKKESFVLNFIGLILIVAASITFRLELRWLLASYLMLLIFFSTNRATIKSETSTFKVRAFDRSLFIIFIALSIGYNWYYAIHFRRSLYFAELLHEASIFNFLATFVHR